MTHKNRVTTGGRSTPLYFFVVAVVLIFAAETFVMFLLSNMLYDSLYHEIFLDSALLSVITIPMLYLLLFRPMLIYNKERNLAEKNLHEAHEVLELRVEERTEELTREISERKHAEKALQTSETNLMKAQEVAHIGSWYFDCATNKLIWTDETYNIFGIPKGTNMTYEKLLKVVHPEDRQYFENRWKAATKGELYDIEHRILVDNEVKWVRRTAELNFDKDGCATSGIGITQDITERKRAEEAIKTSEKKFHLIHDTAFDAIIVADSGSNILEYNGSAEKMFGYNDGELSHKTLTELISNECRQRHLADIKRFCETGYSDVQGQIVELQGLRKSGEVFPVELILNNFDLYGETLFTATIRDVTERKNSEESIKHMAYHDHLTGLPNRLLFKDRLDQVLHREAWKQGTAAVLFLDLDRFKIINDSLGHSFGDELLKVVATMLKGCVRDGDSVARLGGDEFTILLQNLAKAEDVSLVLNKILDTFKQSISINGQEIIIGTSIGASIFPHDGYDSDTLIKNADIAMYRAKSEGRNTFQLYSTTMSTKANNLLKMEHRLRTALKNDEFILHYQPQLDLHNGKLVGMEALVRLVDQNSGRLIPPGDFIPVAEETGLILQLSKWVFQTACKQNKAWQDAGLAPVTVSVNASPRVFRQNDFVPTVTEILAETGLDPQYFEIEVTEETMMGNIEETVEKMNALRDLGVSFSIDDFGTGYSSLSYIKMLPIELLKIDRAFVNDIDNNSDDKAIVKAIIQMAHSMGIQVTAEGVETEKQLAYLNSLGCDKLQGYYFSKPVASDEMESLLANAPKGKKYLKCLNKVV